MERKRHVRNDNDHLDEKRLRHKGESNLVQI